jgi:hypothetical protein
MKSDSISIKSKTLRITNNHSNLTFRITIKNLTVSKAIKNVTVRITIKNVTVRIPLKTLHSA